MTIGKKLHETSPGWQVEVTLTVAVACVEYVPVTTVGVEIDPE